MKQASSGHAARPTPRFRPSQSDFKVSTVVLLSVLWLNSPSLFSQQANQDVLLQWMNQTAQEQLQRRETAIANIRNVADVERRKQVVRQTILSLLGGLPEYRGPLNPKITGRIQGEHYSIEKVLFESLPGFYVTANLYRPDQPGRCEIARSHAAIRHEHWG